MDEVEYLGASESLLSYNLYSYCEGNPICYSDESGNDAIYAINLKMLRIFGHAVLFYQDDEGYWYITDYARYGTYKEKVLNEYIGNEDALKKYIKDRNYTVKKRLDGDYSNAYSYAIIFHNKVYMKYHWSRNNCLHYVHQVLNFAKYGSETHKYKKLHTKIPRDYNPRFD